jgi:hypothetical protein
VVIGGAGAPGFQSFSPDHLQFLASGGDCAPGATCNDPTGGTPNITSNQFFLFDGNTFMRSPPGAVTAAPTGKRATMPDWSNDDKNAVFVVPTSTATWSNAFGQAQVDDDHVLGGSLWTMPRSNKMFGAATEILHAMSDLTNNYYPSYAPDGSLLVFNRVDVTPGEFTGTPGLTDKVSYSNPHAKVFVMTPTAGSMPIECTLLNDVGDLSNSWPRWSPFIQMYKGSKLLWVTFSSTRDYGLLVRNSVNSQVQCYPPDTPENPCMGTGICHGTPFPPNCKQPQIWMSAINLTTAEVSNPGDPSLPAFWLPFQDITTHNHTAQWTSTVVNQPPPDMGSCIPGGQDCTKAPNNCCSDAPICGANGLCGIG